MKPIYIVLICAAGLFFILFLIYLIYAFNRKNNEERKINALRANYQSGNLRKMEYDYASYDEVMKNSTDPQEADQVTIDEVIAQNQQNGSSSSSDEDIFGKVENDGVEEIKGNFKS
jgi:hypothetical protein